MSMLGDGFIYHQVDQTFAPAAVGDRQVIVLNPDGQLRPGIWELVGYNVTRTIGAAAASMSPSFADVNPATFAASNLILEHAVTVLPASAIGSPSRRFLVGTLAEVSWAPIPNLAGDTFRLRALYVLRQPRAA